MTAIYDRKGDDHLAYNYNSNDVVIKTFVKGTDYKYFEDTSNWYQFFDEVALVKRNNDYDNIYLRISTRHRSSPGVYRWKYFFSWNGKLKIDGAYVDLGPVELIDKNEADGYHWLASYIKIPRQYWGKYATEVWNGFTADQYSPKAHYEVYNDPSIYNDANMTGFWLDPGQQLYLDGSSVNRLPTLTLTNPANNQTLSEGNAVQVEGSAVDLDVNDPVTIYLQINNGTPVAIHSGVSDGSAAISFVKQLEYRNKRVFYGTTDLTGADLAENTDHSLKVWAEDNKGGRSAEVTRKFRVIHNRPPVISGTDTNLGVRNTIPTITYSVTEPEGQSITITEYINGVQTKTFTAIDGQEYTFEITQDQWLRLALNTPHQVKIRATDSKGLYSERVYTFTRFETRIQFTLKYDNQAVRDHFILDGQPTRILVTLDGSFPSGSTVLVEACNNFLDNTPTWEDITGPTLSGRGYIFQNNVKTAEQWAINIRITIEKGTATDPVILNGFGGAFD